MGKRETTGSSGEDQMAGWNRSTSWFTKPAWGDGIASGRIWLRAAVRRAAGILAWAIWIGVGTEKIEAQAFNAASISGQVSTPYGGPAASAQVRVCQITSGGVPCSNLAVLYADFNLINRIPNPISTDQYGNYKAFIGAGLYLVQVSLAGGATQPIYTYYVSAGAGGALSSPPAYSIQFASPANAGQFASDQLITINPTTHTTTSPIFFAPGGGTGQVQIGGAASGNYVTQTVDPNTGGWTFTWPTIAPTAAGECLTATTGGVASWQGICAGAAGNQFSVQFAGTPTGTFNSDSLITINPTTHSFSAPIVNTTVNAALLPTVGDIGAKVNAALAGCSNQCIVRIPSGNYSFSTQIVLPQILFGQYKLTGDPGAVLTWTGTTDAIITQPRQIGGSNLTIEGFQLINAGSGSFAGIHLYPTNRDVVQNMLIEGFTDGIRVEGVNSSNIQNNWLFNNVNGIKLLSTFCTGSSPSYTCSPSNLAGTLYASNAINIDHNQINNNSQWGVIFLDSPGNGDSGALNSNVSWNDLELNGIGTTNYGAFYSGKSVGLLVEHNYFEGSPREIVLGLLGGGNYYGTVGAEIENNFFTTLGPQAPATTAYNIELQNADRTTIIGNTEQGGAGVGTGNCFINAATGGETNTVLLPNGIVQGQTVGNRLCINGTPAQTFAGGGSFILFNTNYKIGIAYGQFPIGNTGSDTQASVNVAANSACFATPATNLNQVTAASLMTQVYVQPGNGSFTIFHPSGHAGLLYDVFCTGPLN